MEEYNQIVNDWYVKLSSYFINMVHNKYPDLHIEDIEDLYTEAFIAARENMIKGRVASDTNWKSYIFRIGLNMAANKSKQESKKVQALVQNDDDDIDAHEKFQTKLSLNDLIDEDDDKETLEKRIEIIKREIKYLPEPCETILKDFYLGDFSMTEIMEEIHYKTTKAVKAMKYRCLTRLKERVMIACKMFNLTD